MSISRSTLRVLRQCSRQPEPRVSKCYYSSKPTSGLWQHQWSRLLPARCEATKRTFTPSITNSIFVKARRKFSASAVAQHGHLTPPRPGEELTVTIVDQSSHPTTVTVAPGDNLLDIAQSADLEMEGACGGSCACSTCHVIVEDQEYYDKMPEPEDDENDMLDLAFGLTETSRLGCQVKMSKDLDGLVVKLPSMTRNLQKSDFEKKNSG